MQNNFEIHETYFDLKMVLVILKTSYNPKRKLNDFKILFQENFFFWVSHPIWEFLIFLILGLLGLKFEII